MNSTKQSATRSPGAKKAATRSEPTVHPESLESKQNFLRVSGGYKAADLNKILGDPRESLGIHASPSVEYGCFLLQK
jgi:hypothetical protein